MNKWKAEWTGGYPCLCCGEWILYKNNEKVDTNIPFQNNPADTYIEYDTWHFEEWIETWESQEDGLDSEDWIHTYKDWLDSLVDNNDDYYLIYNAFQENDFRVGGCGGCI